MDAVQEPCVGGINVDDSLMGADLELLAAVLVLMGRAENGNHFFFRGQRNGSADLRAALAHRVHDTLRRQIDEFVVVCCEFDSDFFVLPCLISSVFILTLYQLRRVCRSNSKNKKPFDIKY